ncbi:MAG: hypothetical protein ABI772_04090 [Bacteroidota bacterium]
MKNRKFNLLTILAATLIIAFAGCKKDKEEVDNDTSSAAENAIADAAYSDVANIADEAATGSLTSYRLGDNERVLTSCATISFDTTSVPHLITIDFGTSNCLGHDGNYRRGKILVSYNGHYRDSASTHTITFDNYFVNDNNIAGTKTVTNNGRNTAGNLSFSISINGTITWDAQYGGGTSTHASSRTREWVAGENTPQWNDDVYLISGTSSGVTRTGKNYTMTTVTPLRKRIGFRHFTDGIVDFTPNGNATRTIDYGYIGGAEDNLARVTINGTTFTITLH